MSLDCFTHNDIYYYLIFLFVHSLQSTHPCPGHTFSYDKSIWYSSKWHPSHTDKLQTQWHLVNWRWNFRLGNRMLSYHQSLIYQKSFWHILDTILKKFFLFSTPTLFCLSLSKWGNQLTFIFLSFRFSFKIAWTRVNKKIANTTNYLRVYILALSVRYNGSLRCYYLL